MKRLRRLHRRGYRCVWCGDWTIRQRADHSALCHHCMTIAKQTR